MRKTLAAGIAWILVFTLLFCSCSLGGLFRPDRPGQDGADGTLTPPSPEPAGSPLPRSPTKCPIISAKTWIRAVWSFL